MSEVSRTPESVAAQIRDAMSHRSYAREAMERVLRDMSYKAPEQAAEKWAMIHRVVNFWVPNPPTKRWHWKVVSILTTKSVDQLKSQFGDKAHE